MKVFYSPQVNMMQIISYQFNREIVTVTINNETEQFDFSNLPDGKAENIESDIFEFCPVLSAERKDGMLYLELLNFISFDATEKERFPTWEEVSLDGQD